MAIGVVLRRLASVAVATARSALLQFRLPQQRASLTTRQTA